MSGEKGMVKVTVASSFLLIKKTPKFLQFLLNLFLNVAPFNKFIETHHDLV